MKRSDQPTKNPILIIINKLKSLNWIVNKNVYFGSSLIIWSMVLMAIFLPIISENFYSNSFDWIKTHLNGFIIYSVGGILLFAIFLLMSPFRKFKLGKEDDKPEFSYLSWMAMLFSAGMGIGLLFNGVSEPLLHFQGLPESKAFLLKGVSDTSTNKAMITTFFHWGLSGWAIYGLIGLSLAYGHYKKDRPLSLRSMFVPLLGDRVNGKIGDVIDITAVVGTLFGVASSLGFGVSQINGGLNYLFGVPIGPTVQVLLIAGITMVATISVVTGVDKGVKLLSEINLVFAGILLIFVFIAIGPLGLLEKYGSNILNYAENLAFLSFSKGKESTSNWMGSWTMFYWCWWIAWSPFVGLFIARISKGRTVGEFLSGVLFVPTGLTFLWFTIFGNGGISLFKGGATDLGEIVTTDISLSMFHFLENLPMSSITCILALIVVFLFFVTSSDSGSYVIDMITAGGHPNPPTHQKIYWACMEGIVAAVLLLMGGLKALQMAMINVSLPFTFVLIGLCFSLLKEFNMDYLEEREKVPSSNGINIGAWTHQITASLILGISAYIFSQGF